MKLPLSLLASTLCSAFITTSADASSFPKLPEAVSNNAVALVQTKDDSYLVSFSGIDQRKDHHGVHNKVFVYQASKNKWQPASAVPIKTPVNGLIGRLASVATSIGEYAYVFGGYTVAEDHTEVSIPDVYRYDVKKDSYQSLEPMPVPVDDSIALTYQDRFIYLISGWHNDGNVNLVQVYDVQNNRWQQASPFPGKPVFGQAGGIVDNTMVVCDGVKVDYYPEKRRGFSAEAACYKGVINENDITKIHWTTLPHPTGTARYRMAAMGDKDTNEILFVGGSDNPYNYNGIGYNGKPATPTQGAWRFNIKDNQWTIDQSHQSTMDHRGLIKFNGQYITIGGMADQQQVLDSVNSYTF